MIRNVLYLLIVIAVPVLVLLACPFIAIVIIVGAAYNAIRAAADQ